MFRTRFSVWDAVSAAVILLAALFLVLFPRLFADEGAYLEIVTSETTLIYALNEDQEVELNEGEIRIIVVIEDGEAFVKESTCPDAVCRASGRISKSGESILCAPAGVKLTVRGGADDVDFVAG